jgi:pimeloyl-ACP methyl ester carboxylesterase
MHITRHFVRIGDREVHYRRAGSGPPLVLFHVSPQSSAFVIRDLLPLADQNTLIALDTPGYGESEPLTRPAPTMPDYADAAGETLAALGIQRAMIFGSHTGANIAVELARRAPERVAGLILDGLSLSTPEVAQDRTRRYAPRFAPSDGGEHLAWAWQHTRDQLLFWPWYEPHRENRLQGDVKEAAFLHDVVLAKMAAADYWLGYRAAFSHDSRDALRELRTETYFVTAGGDAHTAVERQLADLPSCIHFVDTTPETQLGAIRQVLAKLNGDAVINPAAPPAHRQALYRTYVDLPQGQRLVRRCGPDGGRPLIMLHGGMRTSALLTPRANALATRRPVIAVDIAGNGDSDPLPGPDPDLANFAEDLRATIAACGLDEFDLYGESLGATLALEIARQSGSAAGALILDRPELPDAALRAEMLALVAPAIQARWDGSHFLTAWHMLRDSMLFWPWYRRTSGGMRAVEPEIEPVVLQQQLLAWLKGRLTYADYIHAALGVDPEPLLRGISHPTLVIGTRGDQLEAHARHAAATLAHGHFSTAQQLAPPIATLRSFLDTNGNI